jgi:hypothetical protein
MSGTIEENFAMDDAGGRSSQPNRDGPAPEGEEAAPPHLALPPHSDAFFTSHGGLRAGWRLLVYFVLREIFFLLFGYAVSYAAQSHLLALWTDLLAECAFLLAALLPAVLLARLESRRFGDYGLPRRQAFGKLFWTGAAWGFGAMTVLMMVLRGVGAFEFGTVALHGIHLLRFFCFWGLYFLIVGFAEEFYLRGYTQFTLAQCIGFWPAALALSIVFGAIHFGNAGETLPGLLAAGSIGLFWCLTLRRTGSLWFAVGFHAAWDWGESFVYSVPDSGTKIPGHLLKSFLHGPAWLTGGSAGPEGSVLLFVLVIVLWISFDRLYPKVNYGGIAM